MNQISTPNAPAAIGPYSQAIAHGDFLFVSGQIPLNPVSGEIEGSTAAEQIAVCISNIQAIAEAAGTTLQKTVKTTLLLTDLGDFAAVNEVYSKFFTAPFPARACYQVVALPKGAKVEVESIIALKD
ncbi:2-iminobutanoate/2-iminopropanoate deaminase [Comamonas sp. BIGb0124]|uniref:RidA family protein n=1 Tax=Comamonas sp. BIGb0124 TaxID=2485130 RepID=UPI000F4A49C7|nr:RidA family protein [Comamonas sp. BIGb0124]ROR22451.1 2-iminobutanoate/2-iminopropanoate deaminase [Comamonas sp. BIGb0124]